MNRDALDEFFAKAEDVLEHWEPSDDAMVARMDDEGADLPLADSYYSQPFAQHRPGWTPTASGWIDAGYIDETHIWNPPARGDQLWTIPEQTITFTFQPTDRFTDAMREAIRGLAAAIIPVTEFIPQLNDAPTSVDDARSRALQLRRERNTGPQDRRGLDGRTRRR